MDCRVAVAPRNDELPQIAASPSLRAEGEAIHSNRLLRRPCGLLAMTWVVDCRVAVAPCNDELPQIAASSLQQSPVIASEAKQITTMDCHVAVAPRNGEVCVALRQSFVIASRRRGNLLLLALEGVQAAGEAAEGCEHYYDYGGLRRRGFF